MASNTRQNKHGRIIGFRIKNMFMVSRIVLLVKNRNMNGNKIILMAMVGSLTLMVTFILVIGKIIKDMVMVSSMK